MTRVRMPVVALAAVVLLSAIVVTASSVPAEPPPGRHASGAAPPGPNAAGAGSGQRPTYVDSNGSRFAPGHVLVAPAAGAQAQALSHVHQRMGARVKRVLPGTRVREVRLPAGVGVQEAVARYERSGAVRYAEPDFLLRPSQTQPVHPNDPYYPYLYGMHNLGEDGGTPDADIDAPEAWGVTTGSADTVVAVIDSGVDIHHEDLADNVWTNPGEIPNNNVDDDGNGYVDDVHGWDFYHNDNTVADGDEDNHGTHVAGTIAATGANGIGVTGVNWRAQVMSVKFLGPEGGLTSDAIAALDYAVANGAQISNNSWGGPGDSRALRDAIERAGAAGHLFVAAAGNGGTDAVGDNNDVSPDYPASYSSANIVSVAATGRRDTLAGFSNYGDVTVDLAAPGVEILSTLPGDSYGWMSGTSMAAPHVTGAAALLSSSEPALDAEGLKARLLKTTDPKSSLAGRVSSGGRLNVGRALAPSATTTLSLINQPATIRFGKASTLSGRLTRGGEGIGAGTVVLQQRPVGTNRWTRVADGVRTTDSDGSYVLSGVRPTKSTDYRARYAGDTETETEPAVSPVLRTGVRVRVTIAVRSGDLPLGRSRVVSGEVRPAHSGTVRLVISRNGSVITRRTLDLSDSRYRFSYTPPRAGTYRFRTVRYADEDHLGGRSPADGFQVVR